MKNNEKALQVQRIQLNEMEMKSSEIKKSLAELSNEAVSQEYLLQQLEKEMENIKVLKEVENIEVLSIEEINLLFQEDSDVNQSCFSARHISDMSSEIIEGDSWDEYFENINIYIERKNLSLSEDPMQDLLTPQHQADILKRIQDDYKYKSVQCDEYDYVIASFCGLTSGLIDSFFVGKPGSSILGKFTDEKVDDLVTNFAKKVFKYKKENGANVRTEPNNIASAIGFFERMFKVNYDARYAKDLNLNGKNLNMRPSDHHLKSLGHSPDIVGLFFSILDQFTGKASFISDGKVIRVEPIAGTNQFELQGSTLIAKLYSGFANWLGHLVSDVAGSSGTRGHDDGRRGSGIPIPFYNLLQSCNFGSIEVNGESKTIAEFSTKVFEAGYDARFGATMAIPVVLNELIIKLLWSLKSFFYHKNSFKDSLPIGNKPELRKMLVIGHGALCLVDGTDAAIRSNKNALLFATHLNMVAWVRFGIISFKEVRSIYLSKGIDIDRLNKDLKVEWERIYQEVRN